MKLYMAVTNDKYELPVAVGEKLVELALMVGKNECTIATHIRRKPKHPTGEFRFYAINVDDD